MQFVPISQLNCSIANWVKYVTEQKKSGNALPICKLWDIVTPRLFNSLELNFVHQPLNLSKAINICHVAYGIAQTGLTTCCDGSLYLGGLFDLNNSSFSELLRQKPNMIRQYLKNLPDFKKTTNDQTRAQFNTIIDSIDSQVNVSLNSFHFNVCPEIETSLYCFV